MTKEEAIVILEKQFDKSCVSGYQNVTKLDFEDALYMAITALRAQVEAEQNKPLTLDELREMDEEPVWMCPPSIGDGVEWNIAGGEWALVDIYYELCRATKGDLAVFENYGKTWLAYRHKPTEGTTLQAQTETGCDFCKETDQSWDDGDAHEFRMNGNGLFYYDSQFGWEGIAVNYCPMCGRRFS